jgi:hypothetical protein
MGRGGFVRAGITLSVAFESRLNCIEVWPISSLLPPGNGDSLHPTPSQDCRARSQRLQYYRHCCRALNPPILNPSAWNLKGKVSFIWVGFCFLSLIVFRLPEPKGLAAVEIDVWFEQEVYRIGNRNTKLQHDPTRRPL